MRQPWFPLALLVGLVLGLTPCRQAAYAETPTLRVGGGAASITTVFMPISDTFQVETGIALRLLPSNPLRGLLALAAGQVDVSTGFTALGELGAEAKQAGKEIDLAEFRQARVAATQLAVFVDKNNQIKSLSKAALRGIFSGRVKNWQEVGGKPQGITVVWGKNTPGINRIFTAAIMEGEAVLTSPEHAFNYADIRLKVRNTPGAIGIDPIGFKDQTVNSPTIPGLECPVYFITKGEPGPQAQQLLDHIRGNAPTTDP